MSTESTTTRAPIAAGKQTEVAVLAAGCFWGVEEILRKIPGVVDTEVGYVAGAESVRVVFDPAVISYATLLERWFFRMHDPTTKHRQGNDVGSQYRSAIFYHTDEQKQIAERVKERVNKSGKWKKPVVTEITKATQWWPGEDYHQKYLIKNPGGYNCHVLRD